VVGCVFLFSFAHEFPSCLFLTSFLKVSLDSADLSDYWRRLQDVASLRLKMRCGFVESLPHRCPGLFRPVFQVLPGVVTGDIEIDDSFFQLFPIPSECLPLGFIFFSGIGADMLEICLELVALATPAIVQLIDLFFFKPAWVLPGLLIYFVSRGRGSPLSG
jgi:hypothetical protein